jgi:uncharacterized protein (DUF1800 family)
MDRRSFLVPRERSATISDAQPGADRNRRTLHARDIPTSGSATFKTSANGGLDPYTDRPEKPWNARRAGHLLRRAAYGCTWQELQAALSVGPQKVVDALLSQTQLPAAPGDWASQDPLYPYDNAAVSQYASWLRQLQEWWVSLMLQPSNMLREKMVLFWHNHFVSDYPTVHVTQYLYTQNQLFREFAFGDFRELTKRITIDNAMLVYLDGGLSKVGNPNENYARELMELFTLGVGTYSDGTPHYTEHDIVELARALTGWTVPTKGLTSAFQSARFDNGVKTILGKSANFGIQGKASDDVIDHIFEIMDPDVQTNRTAVFICEKLYRYFVHQTPDTEIIAGMARTLVDNGWSIAAVLRQLLTSEHFFDENVMAAELKTPADFVLGSIHSLGLAAPMNASNTAADRPQIHDPVTAMWYLAQWLFYPPNVKGWPGGRTWISSVTLPLRVRYSKMWVEPVPDAIDYDFDPIGFVNSLSDSEHVDAVLDDMIALLLPLDIGKDTRDSLMAELLGGGFPYEWDVLKAEQKIRSCLVRLTNLAEYQLM